MIRLHYYLYFDDKGNLISSGFRIHEIDVPEEIFQKTISQLSSIFDDSQLGWILQRYRNDTFKTSGTELRNTL